MATNDDNQEPGFNPKRRLCPDDACIGVIGADGKCTVCGAGDGGGPNLAAAEEAPMPDEDISPDDAPERASAEQEEQGEGFDPNRRLCGDESCIGVIGSDNRCSECGKPADVETFLGPG